jgi:small subunit ribosomal protein S2
VLFPRETVHVRGGSTGSYEDIMALPDVSLRQLLEAGAHFGHQSHRWNPKMAPYIYGARNNIHIIDLAQTVPLLQRALQAISDTVAGGGRVLVVGTKRQAQESVADAARRSAQYYVNARWLGGMLSNWKTISHSIQRLSKLEAMLEGEAQGFTKKERLTLSRERDRLNKELGGIRDMGGLPNLMVVIDTNKEAIAIKEAQRLNIPVAAILDSNSDPDGIAFPVPGNDDAARSLALYCDLIARAAIDGIGRAQGDVGMDIGAAEEPLAEEPAIAAAEADAAVEAPVEAYERLTAPRGAPDDLSKLAGVGPTLEKKLNDYGIFHYWQVAALTPAEASEVDAELKLGGRIDRDGWVAQAHELVAGA